MNCREPWVCFVAKDDTFIREELLLGVDEEHEPRRNDNERKLMFAHFLNRKFGEELPESDPFLIRKVASTR